MLLDHGIDTYQSGMAILYQWQYTCTYTCTYHGTYTCTYSSYVCHTENVMSQLSDWKRAHMCTENHLCFGRTRVPLVLEYHGTYTRVRTMVRTRIPWYQNGTRVRTRVHVYKHYLKNNLKRTYVRTRVRTMVPCGTPWYQIGTMVP